MLKIVFVSLSLLSVLQIGISQITYVTYDEGLTINLLDNYPMDINSDGIVDFHVNKYTNELGFAPNPSSACFSSDKSTPWNTWGSMELLIHEEGELLDPDNYDMMDYIEDGRVGLYTVLHGMAQGWKDQETEYIGIILIKQGKVLHCWMRIKLNEEDKTLTILDYAYQDYLPYQEGNIVIGDKGAVGVSDLQNVLSKVQISPNPVSDILQVTVDYKGNEKMEISILNGEGALIQKQKYNGASQYTFNSSNWAAGMYYVNFKTANGTHTEKLFVAN